MKNLLPRLLVFPVILGLVSVFTACDEKSAAPAETEAPEKNAASAETKIDHVDASGAAKLLEAAEKPIVLDVRTPEEFSAGHIGGAKMIDFKAANFESEIAKLDKDQTYLVHCRSGRRSTDSLPVFQKLGFQHIIHLDGGFNAWQEAGQPVEK